MADISITPGNVTPAAGAVMALGIAGVAVNAGEIVYINATNSDKLALADANDSTQTATAKGMAVNTAGIGQGVAYVVSGSVNVGSVLSAGKPYILSATPGKMALAADLASGWKTSILGYASSVSVFYVSITNTGVAN